MPDLDKAIMDYLKHFGECYPIVRTSTQDDTEIINDIEQCIRLNKKKSYKISLKELGIEGDPENILF